MRRTRWTVLVAVAVVVAALATLALRALDGRGWVAQAPSLLAVAVMVGLAVLVTRMGWNVRQFARGKRPGLDPVVAGRTVALATAAAYTGALLTGWYLGNVGAIADRLSHAPMRQVALGAGLAALAGVALAVAGLLAERWCEVPPDDDHHGGVSAGSAA
jgi:hypothetical protein